MINVPPPRYRIIERGRRLEVIDTHAERRDVPPPPRSMLAARTSPPASRPLEGEPVTKLVIGWSALVAAATIGVVVFATAGVAGLIALGVIGTPLYRRGKPTIDRWLASLR
ncbi:MAG: hypothetical protein M3R64_03620 [Pseudomonadota bacterium]|nr:hypothetical protein [Pseudomonadota bacterium]